MNTSKRILIFTTAYKPFIGGSEIAIEEIGKRLPDFHFDLITPRHKHGLAKEEEFGNVRVFRVGWGLPGDKLFFPVFGFFMAHRLLGAHSYEAIHAYQASQGAGAAWLLKIFKPGLRFILTMQEGKDLRAQGFVINFFRNLIIKKADIITTISSYLKSYTRKINQKARIFLIPNGVDIERFSEEISYGELSDLADRLGIKPGEKVVISASRLVRKNGIDILIKSFAILCKSETASCKLLLVGDGKKSEELMLLAKKLNVFDKIIWAGSIDHAELPKYLKISDVFVRPSRSEGLGSAFLEAMAAGISVIGTRVGGIPDFLKNKETGLFVEVDNAEDLAEKISLIFTKKDLTEKIIKNAKELVSEKYNWDNVARQFEELYAQD